MQRFKADRPDQRPDIVLVVVDDLGWRDLSCYGSTFYETPVIDALARDGALFTDAYATSPVCSPSRASLLSGQYPATVGVTQFIGGQTVGSLQDVPYLRQLPLHQTSLARALREGGYQTWHVGKWHLGQPGPTGHGFDINVAGGEEGLPPSFMSPYGLTGFEDGPAGEYLTDRLTDEAISLVEHAGDQPFFLNLWHYAVHIPVQAPEDLIEKYRQKAERLGLDPGEGEDGELMSAWHVRGRRLRRRRVQSHPGYAAMIESVDTNLGRLLEALAGRGRDSVVVVTSDNGGLATAQGSPTSNLPLAEGKGWLYEGGLRGPLVVHAPGRVAPATRVTTPVTGTDLYPTLLEAAGLPPRPRQHRDGVSLWPMLRGDRDSGDRDSTDGPSGRGPIFWHYPHYSDQGGTPGAAVRDGHLKLIHHFEDDRDELYDVTIDPHEDHDLSADLPQEMARLRGLLETWQAEVGALLPQPTETAPHDDIPDGRDDPWTDLETAFQAQLGQRSSGDRPAERAVVEAPSPRRYLDGRPSPVLRMAATDAGVVLRHGDGPGRCDMLGARDVWVFAAEGLLHMHYDAAGPDGWLCALATSRDGVSWRKHGPVLALGAPGSDDSATASYGTVHRGDDGRWHMFYLGSPNTSPPPERVPAFPYQTMKAEARQPTGPWTKRYDVTPFRPVPGTFSADTASPGQVLRHADGYLQLVSVACTTENGAVLRSLALARTDDLDGAWQLDEEPLLPMTEQVENSSLHQEASTGTWFLFTNHVGIDDTGAEYADAIWVYWSDDPQRWNPRDKALVLDATNCSWSPRVVGLPSVLPLDGRLAVFYDGLATGGTEHTGRDVGLAWLDLPLVAPNT